MSRWKATERKVAAILGGERVPVSGRQRGSAPDVSHSWLSIEVKDRKKLPEWILDAMSQAVASQKPGQLPIVVLHQAGMEHSNNLVVVRLGDWQEFFGMEQADPNQEYPEHGRTHDPRTES